MLRVLESFPPQVLVRCRADRSVEGPNEMESRQTSDLGKIVDSQRLSKVAVDVLPNGVESARPLTHDGTPPRKTRSINQ